MEYIIIFKHVGKTLCERPRQSCSNMFQSKFLRLVVALVVLAEIVQCQQQGLTIVADQDASQSKKEEEADEQEESSKKEFEATSEWKQVQPGEAIPPGLHVRMNLATGHTEAKLMDEEDQPKESQQPKGRQRLLLQQAKAEPSIRISDKKDLPWNMNELKKKMASVNLEAKSESEILHNLLQHYHNATDSGKAALLRDMEFLVHQYDRAVDFVNMGGLLAIAPDLNSTSDSVRELVAFTLGSASQGNPRVQQTVLAAGLLPQLLRLVALDGSVRVRLRCLYALSCLVRQMPEAQDSLLHHGGLTVLAGLFTAPAASLKLQLKAVTLLHDLVIEERLRHDAGHPVHTELTESVQLHGFCGLVPRLLHSPDVDVQEKVVQAMQALADICTEEFQQHVPLLRTLLDNYRREVQLQSRDVEHAADYYEGLLNSVRQLVDSLQQKRKRDEL